MQWGVHYNMRKKTVIVILLLILLALISYLVIYFIRERQDKKSETAKEIVGTNYTDFIAKQSGEVNDKASVSKVSEISMLYNNYVYTFPLYTSLDDVKVNYMNNLYSKSGEFFIHLREGEQPEDLQEYEVNNPLCKIISFYHKSNGVLVQIQCYTSEAYSFFKSLDYYTDLSIKEFHSESLRGLKPDKKMKFKFPKVGEVDKNGKFYDDLFAIETFKEPKAQLAEMFSIAQINGRVTNIYYEKNAMYVASSNLIIMAKRKGHNDYIMTIKRR